MDLVGDRVPLVLVGNKTDLHVDRRVSHEQGKKLAEEMKAVFMETSAKQNQNVEDIFKLVVSQMESLDGGVQGDDKKNCLIMWYVPNIWYSLEYTYLLTYVHKIIK